MAALSESLLVRRRVVHSAFLMVDLSADSSEFYLVFSMVGLLVFSKDAPWVAVMAAGSVVELVSDLADQSVELTGDK